jgi:hypothetical protein
VTASSEPDRHNEIDTSPGSSSSRPSKQAADLLRTTQGIGHRAGVVVALLGVVEPFAGAGAVPQQQVAARRNAGHHPGHDGEHLVVVGDVAEAAHEHDRDRPVEVQHVPGVGQDLVGVVDPHVFGVGPIGAADDPGQFAYVVGAHVAGPRLQRNHERQFPGRHLLGQQAHLRVAEQHG